MMHSICNRNKLCCKAHADIFMNAASTLPNFLETTQHPVVCFSESETIL